MVEDVHTKAADNARRGELLTENFSLDVDFPLNKFHNVVLKDRISIFVLSIGTFRDFVLCSTERVDGWLDE